jgi:hypothetical protein
VNVRGAAILALCGALCGAGCGEGGKREERGAPIDFGEFDSAAISSEHVEATPGPAVDLTLAPDGFLRGGARFFPVGNFLTARDASGPRTHLYLSDRLTDADRASMLEIARSTGANVLSIYTYNENDYEGVAISPYVRGGFGGAIDDALLETWAGRMEHIVAAGLNPVIWLVPDDSPKIHAAPDSALTAYVDAIVARFDSFPVLWILALEADEYWPDDKIERLGAHLASKTARPVGVHQLEGEHHLMRSSWVDFGAYQYGFGKSWRRIFDDTMRVRRAIGKPLFAMEYDLDGGDEDERRGLAAAFGGAAGVGNGAPVGLARFMASLPPGMKRSRTWSRAQLEGAETAALADMKTLAFRREP